MAAPAFVLTDLDDLFRALAHEGYEVHGPTVRDGAIVLDRIRSTSDLPGGVGDEQAPGRYRLRDRGDGALFGYAASPHSPKRELFPPRTELVTIRKKDGALAVEVAPPPDRKVALVGVRACELAAMAIQDRVLARGPYLDPDYAARRDAAFVLAVHCADPAGTCFCVSMGTGPRALGGFDLAAAELFDPHRFVVEVGSDRGARLIAPLSKAEATERDLAGSLEVTRLAAAKMGRSLETAGLPALLLANLEHPRWDEVAERCLGCANCTMSCPTCFCTTVEDTTDLGGELATRTRRWDSCFTLEFGYVAGGSARPSLRARYRQWMTHKLATWHAQFGSSGCTGCGRCITWCPAGIDITEEADAIRRSAAES
jgi:ferredoxin